MKETTRRKSCRQKTITKLCELSTSGASFGFNGAHSGHDNDAFGVSNHLDGRGDVVRMRWYGRDLGQQ